MKRYYGLLLIAAAFAGGMQVNARTPGQSAFNVNFSDTTLRLDYVFGAKVNDGKPESFVVLDGMSRQPEWAGRREKLTELPLMGDGQITVKDAETGDPIYRTSFSSLFQEWLTTDEAKTTSRSFENTFLVPMPRRKAVVEITLNDDSHRQLAAMSHTVDPADILIADMSRRIPLQHRYIHRGGHSDKAIDVAILAEGYTVAEMDSFYRHAADAVMEILSYEPFKNHKEDFNFVAVASPSVESGVSTPRLNDWRDTAMGSNFSTFYSDRYLTTGNVKKVHDLLTNIPYEHIIILANTDEYGGGGIYNSYTLTAARNQMSHPVVVHEFGHSFGGLGDEYFYDNDILVGTYPLDVEPWKPNLTTLVDFDSKWKKMIPKGTPTPTDPKDAEKYPVGLYEGGGYVSKGVYRPADKCRMRTNSYPTFCPVCVDALDKLIRFYTE